MHGRCWVLALIIMVSLDFALPFELTRNGLVLDDEEEAVDVERHSEERPAAAARLPAELRASTPAARPLRPVAARRRISPPPRTTIALAGWSTDPASPVDDH